MAQRDELKVHIKIHSRHQLFDQSGSLPFSIVFGLCRGSPEDTDTRFLILDTSASIFDVPLALKNGYLELFEGKEENKVDLSSLNPSVGPHRYIILPPPLRRAAHRYQDFEIFLYEIDSESDLARLFSPNTKYTIRLASTDLWVRWWRYSDSGEIPQGAKPSESVSDAPRLVKSKDSAGKAAFTTRDSLPSPPNIDIFFKLRTQPPPPKIIEDDSSQEATCILEVSIMNTDAENPVSIQSTGHQQFLSPWGPFQPIQAIDDRKRLTSTRPTTHNSFGKQNFVIYSRTDNTKTLVHKTTPPVCGGLINAKTDLRPTYSDFTTLLPRQPLVQTFDLDALLVTTLKLPDGEYTIELDTVGAWWCWGNMDEMCKNNEAGKTTEEEMEEKIPNEIYKRLIPPIWLKSDSKVSLSILNRRVVCN